jgi:hypothetical protein
LDTCRLCFRPPTKRNPLNKHHIKGRNYPDVMRVHSRTCHRFCDWVTSLYLLHGWEDDLTENFLVEVYHRTVTLQRDGKFTIRLYE